MLALLLGAALAFWGMRRFGGAGRSASRGGSALALLRWFAVVTGALALHELVLLALLHWAPWSWVWCEAAALGFAGAAAFLASRRWVFA
jgi:putative flippase GtrA